MLLKLTFCLREDQLDKLEKLKQQTGAPQAELVRRALDHYFVCLRSQNAPNSTT